MSYVYRSRSADIKGRRPGAMCLLSTPADGHPGLARITNMHFLFLGLLLGTNDVSACRSPLRRHRDPTRQPSGPSPTDSST